MQLCTKVKKKNNTHVKIKKNTSNSNITGNFGIFPTFQFIMEDANCGGILYWDIKCDIISKKLKSKLIKRSLRVFAKQNVYFHQIAMAR